MRVLLNLPFLRSESIIPELAPAEKNRQTIQQYFEDVSDWIDTVAEKFAADCKLDGIDSTFKRT